MSPDQTVLAGTALVFLGVLSLGLLIGGAFERNARRFGAELERESLLAEQNARVIRALGRSFRSIGKPFDTDWLDLRLTHAGRPYGGIGGQEYMAATIVLAVLVGLGAGAFLAGARALTGEGLSLGTFLFWAAIIGPLVAVLLLQDVVSKAKENSFDIEREFPFFLDLAVLVVQAGGTPYRALGKYVEASPGTPLAREIAITAKDADATSFEEALLRLADRVEPGSVKTILRNLAQGEKSSGEAEQFYTEQAEELRHLREELANRTAERLRTNIVFPVFLMLFGIVIAALAPTIISIRSQGFF
jgi:pilus assembly protein TadC